MSPWRNLRRNTVGINEMRVCVSRGVWGDLLVSVFLGRCSICLLVFVR